VSRALAALALAVLLAGCGGDDDESDLVVFGAASLAEVAPEVDPAATVVLGGSNDLAAQLRDGADADVLLSASAAPLEQLREAGVVEAPVVFASNRLVLVVATEVAAGRIEDLRDLARDDVKLVLGGKGVPAGDYAREALAAAGLVDDVNVVSLEEDVKGVLGKVALGEADAGIVYATDARAAAGDVRPVAIPNELQPDIRYYASLVSPASAAGRAYLDRLLGPEGEEALRAAGFLPVPS
jgi:molybdate transport system substrate-binding protein